MPLRLRARQLALALFVASATAGGCAAAGGEESKPGSKDETLRGRATVIDGDGLEIAGRTVRLFGIDAPETSQYCSRTDGTRWRCGQYATVALDRAVAGNEVVCEVNSVDRYDRAVAVCRVGGSDVAAELVRDGWAVAYRKYSSDYVDEEAEAERAARGLWQGSFEMPWRWRERGRGTAK